MLCIEHETWENMKTGCLKLIDLRYTTPADSLQISSEIQEECSLLSRFF
jgi:hypothetical protein